MMCGRNGWTGGASDRTKKKRNIEKNDKKYLKEKPLQRKLQERRKMADFSVKVNLATTSDGLLLNISATTIGFVVQTPNLGSNSFYLRGRKTRSARFHLSACW